MSLNWRFFLDNNSFNFHERIMVFFELYLTPTKSYRRYGLNCLMIYTLFRNHEPFNLLND
jgi:hypothetical protein